MTRLMLNVAVLPFLLQAMRVQVTSPHVCCFKLWAQLAAPCTCMQTVRSGYTTDAKSATLEEIWDNCKCWVPKAIHQAERNRHAFFASWDNATIHKFKDRLQQLGLDTAKYIQLPPHSPDLHMLIEHTFGRLKHQLVIALYQMHWNVDPQRAINCILSLLDNTHDAVCSPITLQKDIANLKNCYKVVAARTDTHVFVNQHWVQGTHGNWPPKGCR